MKKKLVLCSVALMMGIGGLLVSSSANAEVNVSIGIGSPVVVNPCYSGYQDFYSCYYSGYGQSYCSALIQPGCSGWVGYNNWYYGPGREWRGHWDNGLHEGWERDEDHDFKQIHMDNRAHGFHGEGQNEGHGREGHHH